MRHFGPCIICLYLCSPFSASLDHDLVAVGMRRQVGTLWDRMGFQEEIWEDMTVRNVDTIADRKYGARISPSLPSSYFAYYM